MKRPISLVFIKAHSFGFYTWLYCFQKKKIWKLQINTYVHLKIFLEDFFSTNCIFPLDFFFSDMLFIFFFLLILLRREMVWMSLRWAATVSWLKYPLKRLWRREVHCSHRSSFLLGKWFGVLKRQEINPAWITTLAIFGKKNRRTLL